MQPTIKAGIALGLAAEVWTLFVLSMGWHKDPVMLMLFYLVILIQAGILVWGLRMTAAQGKTYGGQVLSGLVISAIGAAIIFVGSYTLTSMVFPDYFSELAEGMRKMYETQGMAQADIQAQLDAMASTNTPFMNALSGVFGTIVTGLILSLIIAAFVKAPQGQSSPSTEPPATT